MSYNAKWADLETGRNRMNKRAGWHLFQVGSSIAACKQRWTRRASFVGTTDSISTMLDRGDAVCKHCLQVFALNGLEGKAPASDPKIRKMGATIVRVAMGGTQR